MSATQNKTSTAVVGKFVQGLKEAALSGNGKTFDSAAAGEFVSGAKNQNSAEIPERLLAVLDEHDEKGSKRVITAILDSCKNYEYAHGRPAPADLMEQAIHLAYSTTEEGRSLDSASSSHSAPTSLQANRAIVAIMAVTSEPVAYAHYLPVDLGSNEAKLAILTHQAGNNNGRYTVGQTMDGAASGDTYLSASREHKCALNAETGAITGKLTAIQKTDDTCDPAGAAIKTLRGRTLVYVNGIICAREVDSSGTGTSTVSGRAIITVDGTATTYQISGTVNPDTGDIALLSTPALPVTNEVIVEGFLDYERAPALVPSIATGVDTFTLHAKPWRAITSQTIDARTQMSNELGLDPHSEAIIAVQAQFANERQYELLRKGKRIAQRNQETFDFKWSTAGDMKVRADIFRDMGAPLNLLSQRMALRTINHGITDCYVGALLSSYLVALPNDVWEPSGVFERPGLFRLGRLHGKYNFYYSPKVVEETETTAQILCVGRATDVTRNPVILGDAVAPIVMPLNPGLAPEQAFNSGAAFYARGFTAVNPHEPSAEGWALLNITDL